MLMGGLVTPLDFNKVKLHVELFHWLWQYGSNWLAAFEKFCSQEEFPHQRKMKVVLALVIYVVAHF